MPRPIRFFVRTGLIYFAATLLLGLAMTARSVLGLPDFLGSLYPTYLHLLVVGWITQLIFGVSLWMFPAPPAGKRYGNPVVLWSIYGTLNAGLLLRALGEPGKFLTGSEGFMSAVLVLSALLQWIAALLYTYSIWGRVRGK